MKHTAVRIEQSKNHRAAASPRPERLLLVLKRSNERTPVQPTTFGRAVTGAARACLLVRHEASCKCIAHRFAACAVLER